MSARVWIAASGDVESYQIEAIFASYESARRWLEEERERQVADFREQWEWGREDAVERFPRMKERRPNSDWDAWLERKLAEPFPGMTEIMDDEFKRGDGGLHGFWHIRQWEVTP
jgi:viroplasmin and RNaseH domain-containing protein